MLTVVINIKLDNKLSSMSNSLIFKTKNIIYIVLLKSNIKGIY